MFSVLHFLNPLPTKKMAVDSKPTGKNQLFRRPFSSVAPSTVNPSGSSPDADLSPETLKNSTDSRPHQFFLPILSKNIPGYENVNFHERTEAIFNLFRTYGVSDHKITQLLRSSPALLTADLEKDILPKLEFFKYIGVSEGNLAWLITEDPKLFARSLENRIVPCYDFLKSILKTDKKVAAAIGKGPWIFTAHHTENLVPNITFLRELGLEESSIAHALNHFSDAMMQNHKQFKAVVNEVKEMGFDHNMSTWAFIKAINGRSGRFMRSLWERSYATYRKWGWSEDDIRSAYLKDPFCMNVSEYKISRILEFLTNKMGWPSNKLARYTSILRYSLENRTKPRYAVVKVLLSKGLLKEDMSWNSVSSGSEASFLERYVTKYENEVPELMSVYLGEVDIWESETEKVSTGIGLKGETTDQVQA